MSDKVEKIFVNNEPELQLIEYSPDQAVFQLLDCDGYRIGKLFCHSVITLCITTRWQSYKQITIIQKNKSSEHLNELIQLIPDEYIVILLTPITNDEELTIPVVDGSFKAYIICESVELQEEVDPGR